MFVGLFSIIFVGFVGCGVGGYGMYDLNMEFLFMFIVYFMGVDVVIGVVGFVGVDVGVMGVK